MALMNAQRTYGLDKRIIGLMDIGTIVVLRLKMLEIQDGLHFSFIMLYNESMTMWTTER
jgi:hypothetical protein